MESVLERINSISELLSDFLLILLSGLFLVSLIFGRMSIRKLRANFLGKYFKRGEKNNGK